jgi:hypothetical protein
MRAKPVSAVAAASPGARSGQRNGSSYATAASAAGDRALLTSTGPWNRRSSSCWRRARRQPRCAHPKRPAVCSMKRPGTPRWSAVDKLRVGWWPQVTSKSPSAASSLIQTPRAARSDCDFGATDHESGKAAKTSMDVASMDVAIATLGRQRSQTCAILR